MDTRGSFPGGKAARHEADQSPPSSADVKNTWVYTSTPPIRLHGVVLEVQWQLYLYLCTTSSPLVFIHVTIKWKTENEVQL